MLQVFGIFKERFSQVTKYEVTADYQTLKKKSEGFTNFSGQHEFFFVSRYSLKESHIRNTIQSYT